MSEAVVAATNRFTVSKWREGDKVRRAFEKSSVVCFAMTTQRAPPVEVVIFVKLITHQDRRPYFDERTVLPIPSSTLDIYPKNILDAAREGQYRGRCSSALGHERRSCEE